ncbi:MAG TPA: benzoate/H(+) symporter BenE family transporter [Pseudomonadales bacterium]|nr:benzoate/H(+) symporter BenE family transporter [Pseudomonadales bacterium]
MNGLFNVTHITAGFIAVLVGYTSSIAIIFQAASAAGGTPEQISSWLWAIGLGMGMTTIGLSLYYRQPVLTAWSTPGAALLATSLTGYSMAEAIGIFMFCSLLIAICGATGLFAKLMRHIPQPLAAAMLGGVLLQFGMVVFSQLSTHLALVGSMLVSFLIARRLLPRYAVPLSLLCGIAVAMGLGLIDMGGVSLAMSSPVWINPEFHWQGLLGVGLPLFIVTMASQNIPGLAVIRANGYDTPASPLIGWTGLTGVLMAPFGGFAYNLAAITAAICMGDEAGRDRQQRYWATVWAGIFYLLTGIFGATLVALFDAFPSALVMAIAGLALLGTIGNSIASGLADDTSREAALLTFLVTASGMSLWGIGSAFWGIVIGLAVYHTRQRSH